jgi:hypothetical protein
MRFLNTFIFFLIFLSSCTKEGEIIPLREDLYIPKDLSPSLKLSRNNLLVSIEVPKSTFSFIATSNSGIFDNDDSLKKYTLLIESKFKENFDFIFFINNSQRLSTQNYGVCRPISNKISGIGGGVFENNLRISNSKKLQSIITLTDASYLLSGPSLHEICHNWANRLNSGLFKSIDAYQSKSFIEIDGGPHWGFSSIHGQLGGFDLSTLKTLTDLPNHYHAEGLPSKKPTFGLVANDGNRLKYAPFELYLMGLIPKSSVPDITLFSGISITPDFLNDGNFFATSKKTLTVNQVILETKVGERVPDFKSSQKLFRAIVVVLTELPLSSNEWKFYENQVKSFFGKQSTVWGKDVPVYTFWGATNEEAFIKADELNLELK